MRTSVRSIAPPAPPADVLAVASAIGARLVREAIWWRRQCGWIGLDRAATTGGTRPAQRSLGPALEDGTAGIALFLAELHAATGDVAAGDTARGAIAQALAHAGELPADGFHGGRLGVAIAAARCVRLLENERLLASAARLARARRVPAPGGAAFDLVSGRAGTVAGLVALSRALADERLVDAAARPAGELIAAARRAAPGAIAWPPPGAPGRHGLCGLAHGAAGGAYALVELFAVTGDAGHRRAAEQALAYPRAWLDPGAGGWPDLRGVDRREPAGSFRSPHAEGWRHGAPGIALALQRAAAVLGDDRLRDEARGALATTAEQLERALLRPGVDFSLGDGLAGRADVLLHGAEPTGARATELALRTGEIGAGRHGASPDGWPCGFPGTRTPGLLDGDAGIGLFYLRLHDGSIPSPLLPAGAQSPR